MCSPCRIFENIGVKSGLIGCVHSMKIGRYSVNLLGFEDNDLVTNAEGVTECQKSCSNGTCSCTGKTFCDRVGIVRVCEITKITSYKTLTAKTVCRNNKINVFEIIIDITDIVIHN